MNYEPRKAVIYSRSNYCQSSERLDALEHQFQQCREACIRYGYTVIAELHDDDSSTSDSRPCLENAIQLIKETQGVLVCISVDHLARKVSDWMKIAEEVRSIGGEVADIEHNGINNIYQNVLLPIIRDATIRKSHEMATQRAEAGRRAKAAQGKVVMSRVPFGYRLNKGKNEVIRVEEELEVVTLIFDLANSMPRISNQKIVDELTLRGIPYRGGKSWNRSQIGHILRNSLYTGKYFYGKTIKNDQQCIVAELPEIACITVPVFNAVQERL